jgi:hypothetical protein
LAAATAIGLFGARTSAAADKMSAPACPPPLPFFYCCCPRALPFFIFFITAIVVGRPFCASLFENQRPPARFGYLGLRGEGKGQAKEGIEGNRTYHSFT